MFSEQKKQLRDHEERPRAEVSLFSLIGLGKIKAYVVEATGSPPGSLCLHTSCHRASPPPRLPSLGSSDCHPGFYSWLWLSFVVLHRARLTFLNCQGAHIHTHLIPWFPQEHSGLSGCSGVASVSVLKREKLDRLIVNPFSSQDSRKEIS